MAAFVRLLLLFRKKSSKKYGVERREWGSIINPPTLYFFKILCYFAHVLKSCKLNIFSFYFSFLLIRVTYMETLNVFNELNLFMGRKLGFICFLIIINSLFFSNVLIMKLRFHILKRII